jgi:hypothetical protein
MKADLFDHLRKKVAYSLDVQVTHEIPRGERCLNSAQFDAKASALNDVFYQFEYR